MNRTIKTVAAAGLVMALGAAALPSAASAGTWYPHKHNNGAALAAGIFGFATGAVVGSALSGPRNYAPAPQPYYAPKPAYYGPPAPWTPAWYSYCGSKYRSFNPNTGYFFGYDGRYHFCK